MARNKVAVLVQLILLLTVALGTLRSFSLYANHNTPIHQTTRRPTTTATHSFLPYFANKANFFNQKLVKLAWAWTTILIGFHAFTIANYPLKPFPHHHLTRILKLHLVATILWILLTQWCFGSSLIERLLILSGAQCLPSLSSLDQPTQLDTSYCQQRWGKRLAGLDQAVISSVKPYWSEGIDISGHTFLLSFSTLLIISTLYPSLKHLWTTDRPDLVPKNYRLAVCANLALVAVWWWMILMTSLYFHGPLEKFSGLGLGSLAWLVTESVVDRVF